MSSSRDIRCEKKKRRIEGEQNEERADSTNVMVGEPRVHLLSFFQFDCHLHGCNDQLKSMGVDILKRPYIGLTLVVFNKENGKEGKIWSIISAKIGGRAEGSISRLGLVPHKPAF